MYPSKQGLDIHNLSTHFTVYRQEMPSVYTRNQFRATIHNARFLKIFVFPPFLGWQSEPWRFMGSPEAMLDAYTEIVTYPLIITLESIGLVILSWLVVTCHLYHWENLMAFLVSGRLLQTGKEDEEKVLRKYGGKAHEGHRR